MQIYAIIALLLAALALACPPPFNNMDLVGNKTHTSAELVQAFLARQQIGYVGKFWRSTSAKMRTDFTLRWRQRGTQERREALAPR
jgi:hypothetical protein